MYESGSRKREFTQTATFTVYNRNAIIWDDMRRLSAFVTPRDETVKTFASAVLTKKIAISQVKQISTAAALFDAMSAYGITYVSDPATPFSTFHGNSVAVDTVNYPTDTLRRKTGDCDDLTSLYASLLESAGISTALVDVPGHVFVLFDSGMKPEEMKNLTGSDTAYLARNGSAWIPVEITALGAPFTRAWTLGSAEVRKWSGLKQFHLVETFSSQETYPPSPPDFPTPPAGFPRLDGNRLAALTREDASRLGRSQDGAEQKAVAAIRARHLPPAAEANEIGIIYAKDGRLDEAKESFLRARDLDPKLAKVYNNLANIACLQNDFAAAKKQYEDALAAAGESPAILINLATLYFDQGDAKQARLYFERALKFDPAYEADYPEIAALLHSDAAVDGTAIAVGEKKATGVQKAANEMERDPRRTRWMP